MSDTLINKMEQQQNKVEKLIAAYLKGEIDAKTFRKEMLLVKPGIDFRRAGLKLKAPNMR